MLASASVLFRPMTVQMPNLALIKTKRISVKSKLWKKQAWRHIVLLTNIAVGLMPLESPYPQPRNFAHAKQYNFMMVCLYLGFHNWVLNTTAEGLYFWLNTASSAVDSWLWLKYTYKAVQCTVNLYLLPIGMYVWLHTGVSLLVSCDLIHLDGAICTLYWWLTTVCR